MTYPVSCEKSLVSLPQSAVQVVIKGLVHTVPIHTRRANKNMKINHNLSQSYREMPGTTVCDGMGHDTVCDGMGYLLQVCVAI